MAQAYRSSNFSNYISFFIFFFCDSHFRYKIIVYSAVASRNDPKLSSAILSLLGIWAAAILLASPLLMAMHLRVIHLPKELVGVIGTMSIAYCAEDWNKFNFKGKPLSITSSLQLGDL